MSNSIFSLFERGIKNVIPTKEISLLEFLKIIKKDSPLLEKIRNTENADERQMLKRKLSYVTFAGKFNKRSNKELLKSSGLACFDIDHVDNLQELKKEVMNDDYTHCLFMSPSAEGFKFLVKIPPVKDDEEYKEYWNSIAEHYNIEESDDKTKDISRACYLSVDKEPYFNPNSKIYKNKLVRVESPPQIQKKYGPTPKNNNGNTKSSEFLDKLLNSVSMVSVLNHFGVSTVSSPTNCPFHYCSQTCLSFNSEVAHCFDTDCAGDDSWNVLSFVKKIKGYDSSEAIEWLSEFAGMKEEYEEEKQKYLDSQKEPRGWANSINIKSMAERHNLINCQECNLPFRFDERLGFYSCDKCKIRGGLKKFAKMIIVRRKTTQ